MTERTLPKWAFRHVQKCRQAFGIGYAGFEFGSTVCDAPDPENPAVAGLGEASPRYERGGIKIRADLARTPEGYEILTHEVLHAALGPQGQAVERILELVPPRYRDHALNLWQDGNESAVTRLARGLAPLLQAMDRAKEPAP